MKKGPKSPYKSKKIASNGRIAKSQTLNPDTDDVPVADSPIPRIESGEYKAICKGFDIGWCFGRRSIYLEFVIQEGRYHDTKLVMICTYPKAKISHRYKYHRQWIIANGTRPTGKQKLHPDIFPGRMFKVRVRDTQVKHSDGTLMPDCVQYSVVDSIIEPLTGGPPR